MKEPWDRLQMEERWNQNFLRSHRAVADADVERNHATKHNPGTRSRFDCIITGWHGGACKIVSEGASKYAVCLTCCTEFTREDSDIRGLQVGCGCQIHEDCREDKGRLLSIACVRTRIDKAFLADFDKRVEKHKAFMFAQTGVRL